MNKRLEFYRKNKIFLDINKTSLDFYGSSKYKNLIQENTKSDFSKINSPFTINQKYNKDLMSNAHRILLHSKIKSNPKYDKLEIECYTCKKNKKYIKNNNIFLTTNGNKTVKKSRNIDNIFKINEKKDLFSNTNYGERKNRKIYTISSSNIEMNKYYFDSNKNVKEFINERRRINKLKYINKLKIDLKEKRVNENQGDINLYDINCISLLKSKNLFTKFETDRNHYNRHLLNELMNNKQILLKILLKQNSLEGEVIYLKKKIDDLKGKANGLKDYKKFLLSVKNHSLSIDNYFNKKSIMRRNTIIINRNNNANTNDSGNSNKRNDGIKKRYSVYMPNIKKNSINKHKSDIKKKTYYKKNTFEINKEGIIREHFIKKEKAKSEPNIFESSDDFYSKMKRIEDALLSLIYKNNKITRQINEMKLVKINELKSLRTNSNIIDNSKIYEELLNNYKDYNKALENKIKLLIAEKENNSYTTLVYKKINQILIAINKNTKKMHNYDNILLRLKNLLNKKKTIIKDSYIFEGIIIIEHFLSQLENDINNNAKNINEENIKYYRKN